MNKKTEIILFAAVLSTGIFSLLAQDKDSEAQRQILTQQKQIIELRKQVANLNYALAPCEYKSAEDELKNINSKLAELDKPKVPEVKKEAAKKD